jgi:hypothetical protein
VGLRLFRALPAGFASRDFYSVSSAAPPSGAHARFAANVRWSPGSAKKNVRCSNTIFPFCYYCQNYAQGEPSQRTSSRKIPRARVNSIFVVGILDEQGNRNAMSSAFRKSQWIVDAGVAGAAASEGTPHAHPSRSTLQFTFQSL